MDKRLAQDIVQYFDMKTMQVLEAYIQDRKSFLHKQLETVTDADAWKKLQGSCSELEQLKKIRDYAIATKEV